MKTAEISFGRLLPVLAVLVMVTFTGQEARAITFGEEDCVDNLSNTDCAHPNVVSLSGFRNPVERDNTTEPVSSGRCSASVLRKHSDKIVFLTAGHCVSFYIAALESGQLVHLGVSFDAAIEKDVSVERALWTPAQYVLLDPATDFLVLNDLYGPQGLNAFNLQFDHGVVVLHIPTDGLVTYGGEPVDLTGIEPVTLTLPGFLETIADVQDPPLFTAVGYGVGEAHNKPGEGGNKGGASNDLSKLGMRWQTVDGTAFVAFMGQKQNLMMGSQNPARDHDGTCGGDSGGPIFYEAAGGDIQVAVTSSGDAICRGSAIMARADSPEAQEFLQCVLDANNSMQLMNCGCTEVNSQGECSQ
ncbi:MAG: hypothetical protein OEM59_11285 [Rhodospirillales bacterium]|nr:hypothetical protein [Rhodospirillales bacterium]